jgi:hypothetical protein
VDYLATISHDCTLVTRRIDVSRKSSAAVSRSDGQVESFRRSEDEKIKSQGQVRAAAEGHSSFP